MKPESRTPRRGKQPNCRRCGKPLWPYIYFGHPDIDPKHEQKWGYNGNNVFCTLRCGYHWAMDRIKEGM